jgi:NAD(P)-dependent dehydrogenase (short-subunit alcohol dehydrogenase family)
MKLSGNTILITGGATGIGLELARVCSNGGMKSSSAAAAREGQLRTGGRSAGAHAGLLRHEGGAALAHDVDALSAPRHERPRVRDHPPIVTSELGSAHRPPEMNRAAMPTGTAVAEMIDALERDELEYAVGEAKRLRAGREELFGAMNNPR